MKLRDICELLKKDEITLDYAGHSIYSDKKYLIERYEDKVALENGQNDGKWSNERKENIDEVNARMRDFYKSNLDSEIEQEDTLRWGNLHDAIECRGCGERLHWTLTGNKLQLRNYYDVHPKYKRGYEFVNHPVDYVCPFKDPKPFIGEIKIESTLLIANFFHEFEDEPEGQKYSDEYSLDSFAGRFNRAKYKAEQQNVAYGQMGNTSVNVYLNNEKTSVIIGPTYHPNEFKDFATDEEYYAAMAIPLFPGYELVGRVELEMWRWEATDLKTLEKKNTTIESLREQEHNQYRGLVELDVKYGTWKFQHNYDLIRRIGDEEKFNYQYARLDLV